jgi:hypothetical protein
MSNARLAVVLAVAVLLAVEPTAVVARQFSFDLDVPPARSSFWRVDDLNGVTQFTAELEIRELRTDRGWEPAFQVRLENTDDSFFLVFGRGDRKDALKVDARTWNGKAESRKEIPEWRPQRGRKITLVMDWSSPGVVSIAADGENRGSYRLQFVPRSLTFSASTGQLVGHRIGLRRPDSK